MKKVSVLEVKRCFIISNLAREPRRGERYLGRLSKEAFARRMAAAKKKVLSFSEKRLDAIIAAGYKKRLYAYNTSDWSVRTLKTSDIGVWRGAGGLPRAWTEGSLIETVRKVQHGLASNSPLIKKRARTSIPAMLVGAASLTQKEKLYPIVFAHNTGTRGRRGLSRKLVGDIDDGCMRSIAIALGGRKTLRVYFGTPKRLLGVPK